MQDPKFQGKIHRNEHLSENGSNYHTLREFSILNSICYRNSTVTSFQITNKLVLDTLGEVTTHCEGWNDQKFSYGP